jgi:hypothetical protein
MSNQEAPVAGQPVENPDHETPPVDQEAAIDAYRSILRLLVGGSLEVADLLRSWLAEGEAIYAKDAAGSEKSQGETARQQALYASIALLFASYEATRRGVGRLAQSSGQVAQFWLRAFPPARQYLNTWIGNHEADLERWIRTGRTEARRSRGLSRYVAGSTVNQVVGNLSGNETIDVLVQAVAGNYLAYLQEHPEQVESLIRSQGDGYIVYLNKNPESVQALLAGQSTGLAAELVDEVRERTVSADNVFEMIARSILRRTPREELTEPPPEVQKRAERAVLPSDLKTGEADNDASN